MNRLELASETVRAALNALAAEAPDWVRALAEPAWFDRYGRRVEDTKLPQGKAARAARTVEVGADGYAVLDAVDADDAPPGLAALPVVDALRRVWARHYERDADGGAGSGPGVRARELRGRGPEKGDSVESPYDPDARYRRKRNTTWIGYVAHLTETCDEDRPRLVVHADTTPGDVHEAVRTGPILAALAAKGFSASEHLVDAGYVSGEHLVAAERDHGVRLVGPTRTNVRWQGQVEGGHTVDRFEIDWEREVVTCPEGHESRWWNAFTRGDGRPYISVSFNRADCQSCPAQALCVRSETRGRSMQLSVQAEHEAREAMRAELDTDEGWANYAARAGVEGTISQGVRSAGLRRTRYRGLAKTRLGHVATAAALSADRAAAWLGGRPVAKTRTSRFAALAA